MPNLCDLFSIYTSHFNWLHGDSSWVFVIFEKHLYKITIARTLPHLEDKRGAKVWIGVPISLCMPAIFLSCFE
jgi:hypothetical protein